MREILVSIITILNIKLCEGDFGFHNHNIKYKAMHVRKILVSMITILNIRLCERDSSFHNYNIKHKAV